MPLPVGSLTPQPLEPRPPLSLQPFADQAVPLGSLALNPRPPLAVGLLLLGPFALESVRHGLPAPERHHLGIARYPHQTGCAWRRTLA